MRIEVSRSGGLMGITRRAVVDTAGRPDADSWAALAREAGPVPTPIRADARVADGFTWSIQVDSEHTVLADQALHGPLRELAERALRDSRARRS